jgi:hypothetical protein
MKKQKFLNLVLDYLSNKVFYDALVIEMEADIKKYLIRQSKKIKNSPNEHSKGSY